MKDFKHLLRIKKSNHHARCSQCLRHRLIIRKLGHCLPARRAQMAQLQKHLQRQYNDRRLYWERPSFSRLASSSSCPPTITAILDSMGVERHSWPKAKRVCLMGPTHSEFHLTADPPTRGSNGVVAALCHLQQQSFNRDHQPWIIFDFSRWI